MNRNSFYLALIILFFLVVGMMIFSYLKNQELNSPSDQIGITAPANI